MPYSIVLLITIIGVLAAFLPYSYMITNIPLLPVRQQAFAQADGAEPTGGGSEGPSDGAEPTGGGSEGPSDGAEPTGGGSEGPSDGAEEESALTPEDADGSRQDFDEFYCDSLSGTCGCVNTNDCVMMVLSGQCKEGTWKPVPPGGGKCDWNT
jgi:hypothetical protein